MPDKKIATPENVDVEAIKAAAKVEALKAEQARRTSINAVFDAFKGREGLDDVLNSCLNDVEIDVEQARAQLLKKLGENVKPAATGSVIVIDTNAQHSMKAMADVLAGRVGLKVENAAQDNPFRGSSLLDMARASLEKRGFSIAGMDKMSIVASAFTHSSGDFGNLLSGTANKMMLRGYDETEETFDKFTSVGSLPDFKSMSKVDLNEAPSLRQVREGAEYKSITFGDRAETVQLATYGELFSINRQAIINDDLDMFTRIPRKMGRAARRTIGDLVFNILINNPAMSDGDALFHAANHLNLNTSAALAVATFQAARVKMAKQKDASGNATLNIRPSILLVPVGLEDTALQLMASETDPSKTNSRIPNTVRGAAEVVSDARLDADSATTWYGLANAGMFDVI